MPVSASSPRGATGTSPARPGAPAKQWGHHWPLPPLACILMVLVMGVVAGCAFTRPIPQIVSAAIREDATRADYTVFVDCIVKNRGPGNGNVNVVVALRDGNLWVKEQTVLLPSNASDSERKVTFDFPEVDPHPDGLVGFKYSCGAEAVGGSPSRVAAPTSSPDQAR